MKITENDGKVKKEIGIYRDVFRGRTDAVPRFFSFTPKGQTERVEGYKPVCRLEFGQDCPRRRGRHTSCADCQERDLAPLSDDLLKKHFAGEHLIGTYPLLEDNTCHFIAADLDDHGTGDTIPNPLGDVRRFHEVCEVHELPVHIERSKSGRGYHAWTFFDRAVPAWKARTVFFALLHEAELMPDDDGVTQSSLDRLFPNQNGHMPGARGFGNLIALPFFGIRKGNENSVFLTPESGFSEICPDQWGFLSAAERASEHLLDGIIGEFGLEALPGQTPGKTAEPEKKRRDGKLDLKAIVGGVGKGSRDDQIYRYACRLREKGLSREEAEMSVKGAWEEIPDKEGFPFGQALKCVASAYSRIAVPEDFEDTLIAGSRETPGFAFQPENLAVAAEIREHDAARWMTIKERVKAERIFAFSDFEKAVAQSRKSEKKDAPEKKSVPTILIEIGMRSELFTSCGEGFMTAETNGHHETFPLMSSTCKKYLQKQYFSEYGVSCNDNALREAAGMLNALAENGKEQPVFCRVGAKDGAIYVDLCNERWEFVRIGPEGWEIVTDPSVKFIRSPSMLPMPAPERNPAGWEDFRRFLNCRDESDFRLIVSWLAGTFAHDRPYPILIIQGEEGTAKSTTVNLLKGLADPNKVPRRSVPREERDLMITSKFSHVLSYDNLSGMPGWLSDAFCRLSTGGGFATRSLYTNNEETVFEAKKPVVLCGIENIATKTDFADRCIVITTDFIPEESRKDERTFMADFEKARPGILGKIFDAVSAGLRNLPHTRLPKKPRMADFALWVQAAESALPWEPGTFLDDYNGNRAEIISGAVGSDKVERVIGKFLDSAGGSWRGTTKELLDLLNEKFPELAQHKKFPKSPSALSGRINKVARSLRANGVELDRRKERIEGKVGLILSLSKVVKDKICLQHLQQDSQNFDNSKENMLQGSEKNATSSPATLQQGDGPLQQGDGPLQQGDGPLQPPCNMEKENDNNLLDSKMKIVATVAGESRPILQSEKKGYERCADCHYLGRREGRPFCFHVFLSGGGNVKGQDVPVDEGRLACEKFRARAVS